MTSGRRTEGCGLRLLRLARQYAACMQHLLGSVLDDVVQDALVYTRTPYARRATMACPS